MRCPEDVNTCEHARNSIATKGSLKSQFENFYREKPKIVDLFSGFGLIAYATK